MAIGALWGYVAMGKRVCEGQAQQWSQGNGWHAAQADKDYECPCILF